MKKFINMDFDGSRWWIDYEEGGSYFRDYFNTEAEAYVFYDSIIGNS